MKQVLVGVESGISFHEMVDLTMPHEFKCGAIGFLLRF